MPTSLRHEFVWLASQSPRRRELLGQIGAAHRLLLPGSDGSGGRDSGVARLETLEELEALEAVRPGEDPAAYVQRVTAAKLQAARRRLAARLGPETPAAPILCADTTVALGRRILGKPADAVEAEAMLAALSGRTHRVLTAVQVWTGRRTLHALSVSRVRVARMPESARQAYVAGGEPFGKAGSYAIQGAFAQWISGIEGSPSGIMGLPLHETSQLLRAAGVRLSI
ncbi:MAG: Maf family protein [Rubrivivax sp.]